MKLVVDTNVAISAVLFHGAPRQLIEFARTGEVSFASSPALIAEFSGTLARAKFADILSRSGLTADMLAAELQTLVELVHPEPLPEAVCRDPDDDDVLACALAARADLIVSGALDLLTLEAYKGIPIVSPARALERVRAIAP